MKLKILPLLLAVLTLASSCSKKTPETPKNTTGKDDGIVYSEPDVSGTNVTFLFTPSGNIPISVCEGGYSMLSGENYYYNLENTVANSRTLDGKKYTAFTDGGTNIGSVSSDGKNAGEEYRTLVTSGNWKLCPNIRKTTYTDKKADSSFGQFISDTYKDRFASAKDVNVAEVWEYDADSDDSSEAIVLASSDDYTVLAFLSQTLGNKVLASSFDSKQEYIAVPFFADLDGNGTYSLLTVCGSGLKTVTVYKENSFDKDYTVYLPI